MSGTTWELALLATTGVAFGQARPHTRWDGSLRGDSVVQALASEAGDVGWVGHRMYGCDSKWNFGPAQRT